MGSTSFKIDNDGTIIRDDSFNPESPEALLRYCQDISNGQPIDWSKDLKIIEKIYLDNTSKGAGNVLYSFYGWPEDWKLEFAKRAKDEKVLNKLSRENYQVRIALIDNPTLPSDIIWRLMVDKSKAVQEACRKRKDMENRFFEAARKTEDKGCGCSIVVLLLTGSLFAFLV